MLEACSQSIRSTTVEFYELTPTQLAKRVHELQNQLEHFQPNPWEHTQKIIFLLFLIHKVRPNPHTIKEARAAQAPAIIVENQVTEHMNVVLRVKKNSAHKITPSAPPEESNQCLPSQ